MVIDDSANTVGYEVTHMMNDQFPSNVAYSLEDVTFSYSRGKRAESEAVFERAVLSDSFWTSVGNSWPEWVRKKYLVEIISQSVSATKRHD